MALSGTYSFDLDVVEIIEEAYDRLPAEARVSYDIESARRSLDLLLTEWSNKQVNLWKMALLTTAISDGTTSYTISNPVIDVLDAVVTVSGQDLPLVRWSLEEYLKQPDKSAEGRPSHFAVQRGQSSLTLYMFPTPDASYTFKYWGLQYVQDTGNFTNNVDIPRRFLPALVAGLSYKLAQKVPEKRMIDQEGREIIIQGVPLQRLAIMKQDYEQLFQEARDEDRDRASFYVVPGVGRRSR